MFSDLNEKSYCAVYCHQNHKINTFAYMCAVYCLIFPLGNEHISHSQKDILIELGILHEHFIKSEPLLYRTIINIDFNMQRLEFMVFSISY